MLIFPIITAKIAFPKRKMMTHTILSKSFSGCKSPNPTVDSVVSI